MIAFKGFAPDLRSVMGDGRKETCLFVPGETKNVPESKTVRSGFHCCENPFECLTYYALDGKNRFFRVEAGGDIDEDDGERIACTEITLLEEMSTQALLYYGMEYMINHPDRKAWEQNYQNARVQRDRAEAEDRNAIAIARGSSPMVKGPEGSWLGLLVEDESGITCAKMIHATERYAGKWLSLGDNREVKIIEAEED
jgi:hypothetical protein